MIAARRSPAFASVEIVHEDAAIGARPIQILSQAPALEQAPGPAPVARAFSLIWQSSQGGSIIVMEGLILTVR